MVGMSANTWLLAEELIKGSLQQGEEWRFISTPAPSLEVALTVIQERPNLEIVCISNEDGLHYVKMMRWCKKIAKRLSWHSNRPWVMFESEELRYLEFIFNKRKIPCKVGAFEEVIQARWESQVNGQQSIASA